MILTTLEDACRYASLHPRLKFFFDYVSNCPLLDMPLGRHDICGKEIFVNIEECMLKQREEQRLELHHRYMDIHIPLTASETIGWMPRQHVGQPDAPFDVKADIVFYSRMAQTYTLVEPGQCLILFPEEAHAPLIGSGVVRKAVGKVLF